MYESNSLLRPAHLSPRYLADEVKAMDSGPAGRKAPDGLWC